MNAYLLTPLAKADIFDIWCYIAKDNEDAANRVELAIYEACAFVAEAPMRGHSRPDLTTRPLRFWTLTSYPNYAVVYRLETSPVEDRGHTAWKAEYPAHFEAGFIVKRKADRLTASS